MEIETIYQHIVNSDAYNTIGLQIQNHSQDKEKAQKYRGRIRCLLVMMMSLGLICVLLLVFITLQYISITAERDLYKNTVEELNHTISSLQHNNTDLTLKTLKVERLVASLSDELMKFYSKQGWFFTDAMNWSASRQYCIGQGGDLVIIKNEVKQRFLSSLVQERMWIGLSDIENEGNMKWVDNSTLIEGFWFRGEPNDVGGNEDCVELLPTLRVLNNWNDMMCLTKTRGICEK